MALQSGEENSLNLPAIISRQPLAVEAGVSKLTQVMFQRLPNPVLLKEPAEFWDEAFIANEARMLAEITHPRIRRKLAYHPQSHQLFLEFIAADTLQDLIQRGLARQDPFRTHQILRSVAETVADLHAGIWCGQPVIHNDLKSRNVLVPHAAPEESVLIDFSHSYFKEQLPDFIQNGKHNPSGTAKYMAPEKWDGDFEHGFKSDVFAFGVLAYYTYTGRHPFEGGPGQIEQQVREATPTSPTELDAKIHRNLLSTMMLCLEKQPNRRPNMDYVARCYAETAGLFQ